MLDLGKFTIGLPETRGGACMHPPTLAGGIEAAIDNYETLVLRLAAYRDKIVDPLYGNLLPCCLSCNGQMDWFHTSVVREGNNTLQMGIHYLHRKGQRAVVGTGGLVLGVGPSQLIDSKAKSSQI